MGTFERKLLILYVRCPSQHSTFMRQTEELASELVVDFVFQCRGGGRGGSHPCL